MPTVSIIVPVYNCEAYLRDCIDSILSQTFQDYELILVDDGSPDSCGKIIDEYAEKDGRIKAIHQPNQGQSSARNTGLDMATGDFLYLPDSDDLLDPSLLDKAISRFTDGYDMIVFAFEESSCPTITEDSSDHSSKEKVIVLRNEEERYRFLIGPFRHKAIRWETWNRIYRREMVEKWRIRFPSDRRTYPEDMYFNYCYVAHCGKILVLPDRLYYYRNRKDSVSDRLSQSLMFLSSNLLANELEGYYRSCEDCTYLSEHYAVIYYLLHKAALRRLRRFQWHNGLTMEEARETMKENVADLETFQQRITDMFPHKEIRESYRKDRNRLMQLTDRLYAAELFRIPASGIVLAVRRILLGLMRLIFVDRREYAFFLPTHEKGEKRYG